MGLKVDKFYDPLGGCFYSLDMGLLCKYQYTFGTTLIGCRNESIRVHGKDLRGAYKRQGRNMMVGWSGE